MSFQSFLKIIFQVCKVYYYDHIMQFIISFMLIVYSHLYVHWQLVKGSVCNVSIANAYSV